MSRKPDSNTTIQQFPIFQWPVDSARLTRGFNHKRPHLGLDLAAPRHTPIYAAHAGLVVYAGSEFSGYGRFVLVEMNNSWASFYGHLQKLHVKTGDRVEAGQLIGTMGDSGRATGVHLHFEIRQNKKAIDPLVMLPQIDNLVSN